LSSRQVYTRLSDLRARKHCLLGELFGYNKQYLAEAKGLRLKIISIPRLLWVITLLGLISFSSTPAAGDASDYAYSFYSHLLGLGGANVGLHSLAEKGVHFVLFFALGATLYNSLKVALPWQICLPIGICFLAGSGSEGIQLLFPERHASLYDVLLNGSSGTLALAFGIANELRSHQAFFPAPTETVRSEITKN
jgi:VanZ family protein